jgi:D-3-phosphoglycerate dehydrogenase
MNVLAYDLYPAEGSLTLGFQGGASLDIPFKTVSLEEVIAGSDFISLHTPFADKPLLGAEEFSKVKPGVGVVNCSRGGTIDELALIEALDTGKVAFAGLDVFDNEPTPRAEILQHPKISLTPHIGAATNEAQERIGTELATLIIQHFNK